MDKWSIPSLVQVQSCLTLLLLIGSCWSHPDIYHIRSNGSRVIQPYSCHDPVSKEEGVCMFSWNCQRSNGTHLTYCMDRFYFGSCCRLPPGVYIATPPPSIASNDVTVSQKYKPRPITTKRPFTEYPKSPSEEKHMASARPSKVPPTEFPPGLVTWRPLEETTSTSPPSKRKPTKLYSTKPLFGSSTMTPTTTEEPSSSSAPPTRRTKPTSSDTSVTRRKVRPSRPYGVTGPKRKTRPTKPYSVRNSTSSRVATRKTKPTRPYHRPTKPVTESTKSPTKSTQQSTQSKIGTWSNILDRTTKPLSFPTRRVPLSTTKKPTRPPTSSTTERSTVVERTRRPTTQYVPTRRPSTEAATAAKTTARPIQVHRTTVVNSQRPSTVRNPVRRPTSTAAPTRRPNPTNIPSRRPVPDEIHTRRPTRPSILSSTRRSTTLSTTPSTTTTRRTTPSTTTTRRTTPSTTTTRRTTPSTTTTRRTTPSTTTTRRTTISTTTRRPVPSTTEREEVTSEKEITLFPPFPGMTHKTTERPVIISGASDVRKSTLRPRPTTTTTARTSTVTVISSTEATTEHTTTEKTTPSQDYAKVCGRPRPGPVGRIVGGGNSYFGEWPWVVSLRQWKKNTFLHKCGATLLNEFWAITAAHCVENVPLSDILLRLGEYDISHENEPLPFVERRVQIVASHPQFDRRTFEYDLALLRFYEPVTFQRNIIPACVPTGNNSYVGKYATVTGWGRLFEDGPLPDVIQEVALPVITNKACENMYRQAGFVEDIPDIFICAGYGDGGKDSCEGDSGGPMVIQEDDGRWVLAGVISWGIGCALPNQPGVYTRITKFAEWINQIIIF